jgi:hypothetical protein
MTGGLTGFAAGVGAVAGGSGGTATAGWGGSARGVSAAVGGGSAGESVRVAGAATVSFPMANDRLHREQRMRWPWSRGLVVFRRLEQKGQTTFVANMVTCSPRRDVRQGRRQLLL